MTVMMIISLGFRIQRSSYSEGKWFSRLLLLYGNLLTETAPSPLSMLSIFTKCEKTCHF